MRFEAFERRARELYREIPPEYREGLDGLVVVRDAVPHPTLPEIYTLGHCDTEAYPSDWEGPETVRSIIRLYWGSFRRLAELDPGFDWEEELWETLTHEVKHHLEWLALEDALEELDYAMDEGFRRARGDPFDPWYYRSGEEVEEGVFRVEREFFLEQEWAREALRSTSRIEFEWRGRRWSVPAPERLGDVHFLLPRELPTEDVLVELVLVRKKGWLETLADLFRGEAPEVVESEAVARPA